MDSKLEELLGKRVVAKRLGWDELLTAEQLLDLDPADYYETYNLSGVLEAFDVPEAPEHGAFLVCLVGGQEADPKTVEEDLTANAFNPNQPRDAKGRWLGKDAAFEGGNAAFDKTASGSTVQDKERRATDSKASRDRAVARMDRIIDAHTTLSPEAKAKYKSEFKKAVNKMPGKAVDEILENVKKVKFYENTTELSKERFPALHAQGKQAGGAYNQQEGRISLDGDHQGVPASEIYTHEMGHAIDHNWKHSNSKEWTEAWTAECRDARVVPTHYAKTSAREGFAEFCRLAFKGPNNRKTLQEKFPRMYTYFERNGYVD